MKAACFSVAAMDYFPYEKKYYAGGNALNQSIRLASLGVDSYFVGPLGSDKFGDDLLALLTLSGVNVSLLERMDGVSANNRIINDDSGERFGEEGAWNGGVFEKYRIDEERWKSIKDFDIWSTHSSCPDFVEAIRRKSTNKLCVDYLHLPNISILIETIASVDIAYIGGDSGMIEAMLALSKQTSGLIVLTMGSEGSACFHLGQKYFQQALSSQVVDTTGCGDAYQAGFTCSYFSNGIIEEALFAGAEQGKLASEHFGGVRWLT